MKLFEKMFRKPELMTQDEFRAFFLSLGYDLENWEVKQNLAGAWELYQEGRCVVSRKPKYMCQTTTSSPGPNWQPSEDGRLNVAHMLSIAVPCPNPGHVYTEEWHDGFTQAVVRIYKCLEHGPGVSYIKSLRKPRFMVIGSSRYVYDSVGEALRSYGKDNMPDEVKMRYGIK